MKDFMVTKGGVSTDFSWCKSFRAEAKGISGEKLFDAIIEACDIWAASPMKVKDKYIRYSENSCPYYIDTLSAVSLAHPDWEIKVNLTYYDDKRFHLDEDVVIKCTDIWKGGALIRNGEHYTYMVHEYLANDLQKSNGYSNEYV